MDNAQQLTSKHDTTTPFLPPTFPYKIHLPFHTSWWWNNFPRRCAQSRHAVCHVWARSQRRGTDSWLGCGQTRCACKTVCPGPRKPAVEKNVTRCKSCATVRRWNTQIQHPPPTRPKLMMLWFWLNWKRFTCLEVKRWSGVTDCHDTSLPQYVHLRWGNC